MNNLIKASALAIAFTFINPGSQLMSEQTENLHINNVTDHYFNLDEALQDSWNDNYEKVIAFIKMHEGFANGKPYYCSAGKLTIGYGHIIQKGEHFPSQITRQEADKLLRRDFNRSIKTVEKLTSLKGSRKLAVAHFVYSKGGGAFKNSTLRKEIMLNGDIDSEFMRWCYYTKNGSKTKVKSKVAERISRWECDMWHSDDKLYYWSRLFN